ncbi:MAG TPA: hypothetical protein VKU41_09275 [Polyangiaceae bacterium]|nr:hypothetical protein [Polyangiaceae bacterium]
MSTRSRGHTCLLPLLATTWLLSLGLPACSRPPPDATPDGALRAFLDEIDEAEDDPPSIRRAFDRLGPAARGNLAERARRTSRLQGRQVEPWEMLAAGLFGLSFRPKAMRSAVVGDRATVEVLGEDAHTEHASVVCVREGAHWRIEPGLPEP